jgi:hypothetical protein
MDLPAGRLVFRERLREDIDTDPPSRSASEGR